VIAPPPITTPEGSSTTEQSSLPTVPSSINAVTQRDLGRNFDRLTDEIREYDLTRGLENQDITESMQCLREELQDLTNHI
jgi:hypothetical protein